MAELKLLIDGEEVELEPNGRSKSYEKWRGPQEYEGLGPGDAPLIVTVYMKPGWKPSQGK